MKALILIVIMVIFLEIVNYLAKKALNLEEYSMDKIIFRIFSGIGNAFIAFIISVAAGALLFLLSI